VTYNDSTGYIISGDSSSAAGEGTIYIFKSHEFHMIALYPEKYFTPVERRANDTLIVTDKLGNPAKVSFDDQKRLSRFVVQNPSNHDGKIIITYKDYKEIDGNNFADKIEILQSGKYEFKFDFSKILVNSDQFKKVEL
jgi:hypothetical protein